MLSTLFNGRWPLAHALSRVLAANPLALPGALLAAVSVALSACAIAPPPPTIAHVGGNAWQIDVRPEANIVKTAFTPAAKPPAPRLKPDQAEPHKLPKGGGYYKVGKPYEIAGIRYVPREKPGHVETGTASWYGPGFHAKKTANGEIFDQNALTAAHRTLPLPSYAYITNLENGRTLLVRINDRGPFKKGRMLDVSLKVAQILGFEHSGTAQVKIKYAGRAPIDGDESRERAHLANQSF